MEDNDINMDDENEEVTGRRKKEENQSYFHYDKKDFDKENILQFLFDNNILKNKPFCEKCNQPMKLVSNKKREDRKIWRCTNKG